MLFTVRGVELHLRAYARERGRNWKSKLRDDWMNARTTGIMQALRNSHGPSWLASYALPKPPPAATSVTHTVPVTAANGDIYEATRVWAETPWTITYPKGQDCFWGTETELRAHIRRLISEGPAAKIAP